MTAGTRSSAGLFNLKPPPDGEIDGEARELIDGRVRQQALAP
jgi:hypothetical protein